MAGARRVTVEDLDAMTPAERREAFEASIVWDPQALPADRQAVLTARAARFAAERDAAAATGRGGSPRQIAPGE